LIRLDGADVEMLHAVHAASPDEVTTGGRVTVRWSDAPEGGINDIVCFDLIDGEPQS